MSVTLDLPPNILEQARKYAASEGVSLDMLVAKTLEMMTNKHNPELEESVSLPTQQTIKPSPLGLFPGVVLYMADDFDAPLEDFKEYME